MNPSKRPSLSLKVALVTLSAAALYAPQLKATTILYPDFSDLSGLQLNGATASIGNPVGSALRLTNNLGQGGSAFSTSSIALGVDVSFSTFFSFNISNPLGSTDTDNLVGADGIVFVVQTVSNTAGGIGGGIGYDGLLNSVGVEFDTWNNGGIDNNDGNHIGIDIGGSVASVALAHVNDPMNTGNTFYSWIDYNGTTNLLEARLSTTNSRPAAATLSYNVNLATVLGSNNAYVGFTSGTGSAGGNHDILNWEFRDTYNPVGVPDGGSTLALLGCALGGIGFVRRMLLHRA